MSTLGSKPLSPLVLAYVESSEMLMSLLQVVAYVTLGSCILLTLGNMLPLHHAILGRSIMSP